MEWKMDEELLNAVKNVHIDWPNDPIDEYQGRGHNPKVWKRRVMGEPHWPQDGICSPANIINAFRNNHDLEALAMIINWSLLHPTSSGIYGMDLKKIKAALLQCRTSIQNSHTITDAWVICQKLEWSSLAISNVLHFLCRALEKTDPPVPMGNLIREKIRRLLHATRHKHSLLPMYYQDYTTYERYMTAIMCWKTQKNWTTTQVKNTIFYLLQHHQF